MHESTQRDTTVLMILYHMIVIPVTYTQITDHTLSPFHHTLWQLTSEDLDDVAVLEVYPL